MVVVRKLTHRLAALSLVVAAAGCTSDPSTAADPPPVQSSSASIAPTDTTSVTTTDTDVAPTTARVLEIPGTLSVPQLASEPVVIAHRGASGYRPEHTLAAFALAIEMGADIIEPDVVMTGDGHAIVRHENQLDLTTDVAQRDEFADRRTTKVVDGRELTGWFSEDFTLEEITSLRAVERFPELRPESARFDGEEPVPTLRDVLQLLADANADGSVDVGVYPEVKQPSHFGSLGLDPAAAVVADLTEFGYVSSDDGALIQSTEVGTLRRLNEMTDVRLVQLLGRSGAPRDQVLLNSGLTFADMATPAGLAAVADYADGVAVDKNQYIIPLDEDGALDEAARTSLVDDAHALSLFVHAYTFRAENQFLPTQFRSVGGDGATGDSVGELAAFIRAGIDGFFTDHVDLGRAAVPLE